MSALLQRPRRPVRFQRGQSLVEFTLVIPILLILLVAIADFGRVFATGITLDAAIRNAAEIGAQQYLSTPPGPLEYPAPNPPPSNYYQDLHQTIARAVCAETRTLPNSSYNPTTQDCVNFPAIRICVHDNVDDQCGQVIPNYGGVTPVECPKLTSPAMTNSQGGSTERWVEVRVCYPFTSILRLPIWTFSDIYIERERSFVIACYIKLGEQRCG